MPAVTASEIFRATSSYIFTKLSLENAITPWMQAAGFRIVEDFEIVAMKTKTYTTNDYISIMEYLIGRWDIPNVKCVSPAAQEAQDYVCALPKRLTRLAQRTEKKLLKRAEEPVQFSWIFDRTLMV